ncbi:hypothetical protein RRSWK_01336 [Rhodopirellula sp. SWK7]|nr:hypothetical protein RRSWK_01336 [Rhodopirellula sp. SWK7]
MSWFIVSLVCISARCGEWIKTKRIFRLSAEGRLRWLPFNEKLISPFIVFSCLFDSSNPE